MKGDELLIVAIGITSIIPNDTFHYTDTTVIQTKNARLRYRSSYDKNRVDFHFTVVFPENPSCRTIDDYYSYVKPHVDLAFGTRGVVTFVQTYELEITTHHPFQ